VGKKTRLARPSLVVSSVAILGAVVLAAAFVCSNIRGGAVSVCLALDAMPNFPNDLVDPQIEDRQDIEKAVQAISKYDLDTIRAGMKRYYCDQNASHATELKLYMLNHYLFALPATIRRDSPYAPFFMGYGAPASGEITNPQPADEIDARWPWSADSEGEWRLTGTCGSTFFGLPYRAFEDFDYCRQHFGVRKPIGKTRGWPQ
jgi:hypothetical protein